MHWKIGKSPYLRSASGATDDLLIVANSFEPRCLFGASTANASGYTARQSLLINFESANATHAKIKAKHLKALRDSLRGVTQDSLITEMETRKYDSIAFSEDLRRYLRSLNSTPQNVLVDISTFTKCALAALLSGLFRENPAVRVRCVWTPGVYGDSLEITRGVKDTFVVPGFGGVGWKECRVLVLFLGQELSRAYSLWRTVDPDQVFLIASESEYSTVSAESVLASAKMITALVDSTQFVIDGIDPEQTHEVLTTILRKLKLRNYEDEVAVACFGTKLQMLGVWAFFHEHFNAEPSWHYVYAAPKAFAGNKYTKEFVRELNEVDLLA
jgi:hypothetical protein